MPINTLYSVQNTLLLPYIKNYFTLDFSSMIANNEGVKVPPMGFPVLQFHFGGNSNFYHHKHFTHHSLFIGQCSRHILLYPTKETKLLGVNFKPYGLYNLFGISPRQIFNSGVESYSFFGLENVNYISQLLKQGGIQNAIEAVENLFLSYRYEHIVKYKHFDDIVDQLEFENGLINCAELLGNNISRRTFQRYFIEVIGISPKLFCQVLRHKYIIELLYKNPEMKWSDMQLNGFYYDFAHFYKDFILFSGLTPQKYLPIKNTFAKALLKIR